MISKLGSPLASPRFQVVSPSLDRRSHLLINTAFPVSSSFPPSVVFELSVSIFTLLSAAALSLVSAFLFFETKSARFDQFSSATGSSWIKAHSRRGKKLNGPVHWIILVSSLQLVHYKSSKIIDQGQNTGNSKISACFTLDKISTCFTLGKDLERLGIYRT